MLWGTHPRPPAPHSRGALGWALCRGPRPRRWPSKVLTAKPLRLPWQRPLGPDWGGRRPGTSTSVHAGAPPSPLRGGSAPGSRPTAS
eukprot:9472918-Pyramimonas_sp.AAC.1